MNRQKLMKVTYYDPKNNIRLTGYSDAVVWDDKGQPTLMALRFGGYFSAAVPLSWEYQDYIRTYPGRAGQTADCGRIVEGCAGGNRCPGRRLCYQVGGGEFEQK